MPEPRIEGRRSLGAGRHLELEELIWRTSRGQEHRWERAVRRSGAGSVAMIARLVPGDRYILVRQFRPPTGGLVLEFPAGLLEPGEDPAVAAVRELEEETGYRGRVLRVLLERANCPGMIAERTSLALMEVDEALPANRAPRPSLEDSEDLHTVVLSLQELERLALAPEAGPVAVDAKVSAFVLGLSLAGEGGAP